MELVLIDFVGRSLSSRAQKALQNRYLTSTSCSTTTRHFYVRVLLKKLHGSAPLMTDLPPTFLHHSVQFLSSLGTFVAIFGAVLSKLPGRHIFSGFYNFLFMNAQNPPKICLYSIRHSTATKIATEVPQVPS